MPEYHVRDVGAFDQAMRSLRSQYVLWHDTDTPAHIRGLGLIAAVEDVFRATGVHPSTLLD